MTHNGIEETVYPELSYRGINFTNALVVYSIIWIILALVCIAAIAYFISFKPQKVDYEKGVTIFTAFLIIAILSILYPSLTWFGIDWCEGIIFYQNLQNMSFVRFLTQLEGGMYLSEFNNAFMWIANKLLHGQNYTFVIIQILMMFLHAYIGSFFCRKPFGKFFSLDFRCVFSIIISCFIYTVQEYALIGTPYFGVLFIILLLADDSEKQKPEYILQLLLAFLLCLSKMVYVLFLPVAGVFYLLNRKTLSKAKKYFLILIIVAVSLEASLSVVVKGGVTEGGKLGTIQSMSLLKLIEGVLYFSIQMFNSSLFQEMSTANGFALNGLMFFAVLLSIGWCISRLLHKSDDYKAASFILSMHLLNFGNCALQLLSNHAIMIPENIHWMIMCYIPVNDKWWWYSFSYVAVYAVLLAHIFVLKKFANHITEGKLKNIYIQSLSVFAVFAIGIVAVNQYAYRGDNNHTYKLANQFTDPAKMVGNFTEYYSLQDDEHFLIMASYMPNKTNFYYIENANYHVIKDLEKNSEIDISEATINNKNISEIYVHKEQTSNQIRDDYYYAELYSANGDLLGKVCQLDKNKNREYVCFNLDEYDSAVSSVKFVYEDGSLAFIDNRITMGVY